MGLAASETLGPGRRCARHALAAGPDGLCALCRSERSESLPPSRQYSAWVLGGILVAILLVSGGAVVYRAATSFAHAAIAQEPQLAVASVASPTLEAPADGPAAQLDPDAAAAPIAADAADFPPTPAGEASPASGAEPTPVLSALPPAAVLPAPERPAAPTRAPPTAAELQAALSATPIIMYSASWCGVCRKAKQFFSANGLRYQEIDADTTPGAWQKIEQLTGRRAVPLIIVDGEQTPPGLSASNIMRAASRSVERRLGVQGIQVKAN